MVITMKTFRWAIVGLIGWLVVVAAMAGGNGKHLGWPNHGITAPGQPIHQPNNYGAPHPVSHP